MKRFFQFVEIKTKITSLFPFFMTAAWIFTLRQPLHWQATAVFFVSMFSFDLTTTAINNYTDKTGDHELPYGRGTALSILLGLLTVSVASGLYLAMLTDIVVLLTGAVCFVCGILYSYGPVPISATPFGELLSGIFYGFFIPFLLLYINCPTGSVLSFAKEGGTLVFAVNIRTMMALLLFSVVPVFTTANIMLANNICDVQKDILVKRYTLPHYLEQNALRLFEWLYYLCYLDVVVMVLLHMLPVICLAFLLTGKIVWDNIRIFRKKQEKAETFITSVRNYIVLNGALTALIFAGRFIG
jgi:1,4-dihydroxy-2-naphthoate octaprenyltransferase